MTVQYQSLSQSPAECARTLDYNGLTIELHPEVYEPAEDTFLLLRALELNENGRDRIFEMGTGCGLIALECARRGAKVVCSDINPYAIQLTQRNIDRNARILTGTIEVRCGDLFSVIHDGERFETVIFNPPYLPTLPEDRVGGSGWFDRAIDGGIDGLQVIQSFIAGVHRVIQEDGRAYFVFSSLSQRPILEECVREHGFEQIIVCRQTFDFEVLEIYRLQRR